MQIKSIPVYVRSQDAILRGDIYLPEKKRKSGKRIKNGKSDSAIIIETSLTLNRHGVFAEFARYFAEHGFTSFVYDKRSHNDSTGEFSCSMLKQDLLNVIKHLSKEYGIKKVGMFGFCYGGIPSMQATAEDPKIKIFCGINTYSKYLPLALKSDNGFPLRLKALHIAGNILNKLGIIKLIHIKKKDFHISPLDKGTGFKGDISRIFQDLASCEDAIESVKLVRKPFYIFYGGKDKLVPGVVAQRLYDSCPSKNKGIYHYDKAGHFFNEQREDMLKDCLNVYLKHL